MPSKQYSGARNQTFSRSITRSPIVAEERVIPAATEVGAAVLTDLSFARNRLFRAMRGQPLPEWVSDFDATSWAQFFLKYLLGNEAVTAVIPGTSNPEHLADSLGAGRGHLPDAAQRRQMVAFFKALHSPAPPASPPRRGLSGVAYSSHRTLLVTRRKRRCH
jgi:diketogulonate reductase-like aldo/keto reductase